MVWTKCLRRHLNHVLKEIRSLVDRYGDNRFIASCRVAAYTFGGFTRFKDVAMAAFEDEQIEQFIKNWFQKDRDLEVNTAERCWELLSSNDYKAAKELAQTPLLLTLLCVVYDEFQDFPKKRHALYGEALDVLLRKWASEKRIQRNPIYQELSAELELDMLAEIAYTSFADDQLFFAKDRLVQQIREFLVENLNAPSHLDAETVLREIEIQQGILVERARDAYSFSHLTFQEYLTAKCIVDNQKIDRLVRDHITEQHWREVFLLVAGLAPGKGGADELLLAMERQAQTYITSDKIKALIEWATASTAGSSGDSKAPAKRVAAIFLVLDFVRASINAITIESAHTSEFMIDQDLALANDLALALSFNHNLAHASINANIRKRVSICDRAKYYQELEVFGASLVDGLIANTDNLENHTFENESIDLMQKESIIKILNYFCKNLKFDFQKTDSSYEENHSLVNYFYTLELMIRCKEAAVRVSPQVWAGIESRMVTVPE
jgi:hypothetical protein